MQMMRVKKQIFHYFQMVLGVLDKREKLFLASWLSLQSILVTLDLAALAIAGVTVSAFVPIVQSNPDNIPKIVLRMYSGLQSTLSLYEFLFVLVGISGLLLIIRALITVTTERFFYLRLNLITKRLVKAILESHFSTPIEKRFQVSNSNFLHAIHESLNSFSIYVLGNLVLIFAEVVNSLLLLTVMFIWKPLVTGLLLCFIVFSVLISFRYHIKKSNSLLKNFSQNNIDCIEAFTNLNSIYSELKLRSLFQTSLNTYLQQRGKLGELIANRQVQFGFPRLILESTIIVGGLLSGMLIWYTLNVSEGLVLLATFMILSLRLQPAILKIQNGVQVMLQHKESSSAAMKLLGFYGVNDRIEVPTSVSVDFKKDGNLNIHNLSYKFGDDVILFEGLEVSFQSKGLYLLKGDNGVGKSTFFEIIAGLRRPFKGSIEYKGLDLLHLTQEQLGVYLSYFPQKPHFFTQTIFESLMTEEISDTESNSRFKTAISILDFLQFDLTKHDLFREANLDEFLSD